MVGWEAGGPITENLIIFSQGASQSHLLISYLNIYMNHFRELCFKGLRIISYIIDYYALYSWR